MRAFVAVDVPPDDTALPASRAPRHLTLLFLGDVPPELPARIERPLRDAAAASAPFRLRLEGVGAFPYREAPRVVWVGATVGRVELEALAARVREAVARAGGPTSQEAFVAHMTLFRVRSPADRHAALELLDGRRPPPPPIEGTVREVLLKESVLRPGGADHRTLARFPLG